MWKIIRVDSYDRETREDRAVCAGFTNEGEAKICCKALQDDVTRSECDWFRVVPEDYRLWRGMAELV